MQVTLTSVPANGYNSSISRIGGGKPIRKAKREPNMYLKTGSHSVLLLMVVPLGWAGNKGKTVATMTASVLNDRSNEEFWEFENFYNKRSVPAFG